MAPAPTTAPPSDPAATPPPFGPDARRLHRSRRDRHLAGVAGGVAAHVGIDATLLRGALVVAGLCAPGVVALAYLAAWVLLAEDDRTEPLAQRWYREHGPASDHPVATVALAATGLVVLAAVSSGWGWGDATASPTVAVVALVAVAVLVHHDRRGPTTPDGPAGPGGGAGPGAGPTAPGPADPSTTDPTTLATPTDPTLAAVPTAPAAPPVPDDPTVRIGPATATTEPVRPAGGTDPTVVDRTRRRLIRNVVVLAALEAGAVTAALWATDTGPTPGWLIPASVLAVLLLGLATAPLWGWSWGLATLALATVPVLVLAVVPGVSLRGGLGDQAHRPTSVADLPDRYRLGVGHHQLDLTALDLAPGSTTVVRVATGIGATEVRVPPAADLVLRGRLGGGQVVLDDEPTGLSGADVALRGTFPARPTGAGEDPAPTGRPATDRTAPPTLVLDAEVGLGALDLRHRR